MTPGYWNRPDDTALAITDDGWFHTGDAGYFDSEGYLYIRDRVKDMIITGGENVFPAEVEDVLMSHPPVADVAVIGVPDEKWGETVKAVVVTAPGHTVTDTELAEDKDTSATNGLLAHSPAVRVRRPPIDCKRRERLDVDGGPTRPC
jgi:acyl-CoA synthetase (AMP-forming)/AMP-acid ligase II